MSKPVGGRGHKAPYQTITVRIPLDIRSQVDEIAERFRANDREIAEASSTDNLKTQLLCIIEGYKAVAKSSRDWTKCNQLIQELEAEIARYESKIN